MNTFFEFVMEKVLLIVLIILALILAIVVPIAFWGVLTGTQEDILCRGGYEHNSYSGRQILNENGGGIPCVKEIKK